MRGRARAPSVAAPLRDAYAEKQALAHMHQMEALCDQTFRTRQKLLRYTGGSEQVRLKTVIDERLLNSEKVWGRLKTLLNQKFEKEKKWPDLDKLAEYFRSEVALIKNTLCRDHFREFSRF